MQLNRIAPPSGEPVTLSDAKAHLRVDLSDDDAMILRLIAAAREWVEVATGRALMTQTWRMTLDAWPRADAVTLIRPPVQAIVAVRTIGANGAAIVWNGANYALTFGTEPQSLLRIAGEWPPVGRQNGGIEIDVTCGYGAAADVPAALKQAMLTRIARSYERRGEDADPAPDEAMAMIAPFRTVRL